MDMISITPKYSTHHCKEAVIVDQIQGKCIVISCGYDFRNKADAAKSYKGSSPRTKFTLRLRLAFIKSGEPSKR